MKCMLLIYQVLIYLSYFYEFFVYFKD